MSARSGSAPPRPALTALRSQTDGPAAPGAAAPAAEPRARRAAAGRRPAVLPSAPRSAASDAGGSLGQRERLWPGGGRRAAPQRPPSPTLTALRQLHAAVYAAPEARPALAAVGRFPSRVAVAVPAVIAHLGGGTRRTEGLQVGLSPSRGRPRCGQRILPTNRSPALRRCSLRVRGIGFRCCSRSPARSGGGTCCLCTPGTSQRGSVLPSERSAQCNVNEYLQHLSV